MVSFSGLFNSAKFAAKTAVAKWAQPASVFVEETTLVVSTSCPVDPMHKTPAFLEMINDVTARSKAANAWIDAFNDANPLVPVDAVKPPVPLPPRRQSVTPSEPESIFDGEVSTSTTTASTDVSSIRERRHAVWPMSWPEPEDEEDEYEWAEERCDVDVRNRGFLQLNQPPQTLEYRKKMGMTLPRINTMMEPVYYGEMTQANMEDMECPTPSPLAVFGPQTWNEYGSAEMDKQMDELDAWTGGVEKHVVSPTDWKRVAKQYDVIDEDEIEEQRVRDMSVSDFLKYENEKRRREIAEGNKPTPAEQLRLCEAARLLMEREEEERRRDEEEYSWIPGW
ncbi:hypothetical protein G7K_2754-t1 [Saitoella complicata NRRL Y-17804]|uniref:Uncharacterized protein n=1 Tax=Saitoella complicata (strain BCRC 22490 / CBS 7301 / JCM 7358 / NBRC 10748 / NRRL Y-17804) TaxID=698492 RepID=A0A0E9NFW7_SAICN|nr:hypothetical protein G7K_2754-t1 [Saitoella complicata NRRL Y-17804]